MADYLKNEENRGENTNENAKANQAASQRQIQMQKQIRQQRAISEKVLWGGCDLSLIVLPIIQLAT